MVTLRLKRAANSQTDLFLPFSRLKLPSLPRLRECPYLSGAKPRQAKTMPKQPLRTGSKGLPSLTLLVPLRAAAF